MKRTFALILALALMLALAACTPAETTPTAEPTLEPTPAPTAEPTPEPTPEATPEAAVLTDMLGREVALPAEVKPSFPLPQATRKFCMPSAQAKCLSAAMLTATIPRPPLT